MRTVAAWALVLILTSLAFVAASQAFAAEDCIPPAQLRTVQDQRNAANDQVAAIVAQAQAEIARLTKELEAAKKPEPKPPTK